MNLGRHPLKIWGFVTNITNEIILGLDILLKYNASVDIGRQSLRLADEELSLRISGAGPRPSSLVVAKDQVILAQCEGIVMARLQSHLRVENGLIGPSPPAPQPEEIYIARTLVQERQELPVVIRS
jgi:hypothetical protein